jgi:hypothetical protein
MFDTIWKFLPAYIKWPLLIAIALFVLPVRLYEGARDFVHSEVRAVTVPEFYEFDVSKNLIVKNKIVSLVDQVTTNEEGESVVTQEEVIAFEINKIINPVVFLAKGLMIKPC